MKIIAPKILFIQFVLSFGVISINSFSYSQDDIQTDSYHFDTQETIRIYRNPEERREAGFGTPINDWLNVSGLFEIEKIYKDDRFTNDQTINQDEPRSHNLQLGFEAEFSEFLSAELVVEGEYEDQTRTKIEEAILKYDYDDWGIEIGYQDLPFGEYYSHFITGPLLEFGETTQTSLVIDYSISDNYDVFTYVFDGETRQTDEDTDLGWGLGFELANDDESIRIGTGYLSNLAESNEFFLEDSNNNYDHKVPAWNVYTLIGFDQFELTAEYVGATKTFTEFDSNQNKPSSYNIELAWFLNHSTQLAFRIENSKEFFEQPQWQYGIAATWRINDHLSLSAEYLKADYKNGFVVDDEDQEFEKHHQYGLQIGFEF